MRFFCGFNVFGGTGEASYSQLSMKIICIAYSLFSLAHVSLGGELAEFFSRFVLFFLTTPQSGPMVD